MYIEHKKYRQGGSMAWTIVLLGAAFFFFDFVQVGMIAILKGDMAQSLGILEDEVPRYFSTPFSMANWLFAFPAALLVDRYSLRQIFLSSLGLAIFALLGSAWVNIPLVCAFFRLFSGISHAFCFLLVTTLCSRWFAVEKRALVMGIAIAIGVSALSVANYPLYLLKERVGWRFALTLHALLGVGIWALAFLFLRDYPEAIAVESKKNNPISALKEALLKPRLWAYALYIALLNAPIPAIAFYNLKNFLLDVHQMGDEGVAAQGGSILFLGHVVGLSLAGSLAKYLKSYQKPMLLGSMAAILIFFLLLFSYPMATSMLFFLLFLWGMVMGAQVIAYPAIDQISPSHLRATSMSIASFVLLGSLFFYESFMPYFFQWISQGKDAPYGPLIYQKAFLPILLALLGSMGIAFFSKDEKK